MGRPSAAAQDIRLPPRAPAPAPLLPPRAAPCPAQRSWPHLPAKHQLKRLFWQKQCAHDDTIVQGKHFPFYFPWRSSRQFPERSSDHSQRPLGHSGSDGSDPSRLYGLQVGHPSPSPQQSCSYSPWERCPGYKASLTEPLGSPRQAPCCPGGPLLVIPYNLCALVSHHWPDTFGRGWTNPGRETADSLPPSVMCRKVALLVTHFSLSGLCSS